MLLSILLALVFLGLLGFRLIAPSAPLGADANNGAMSDAVLSEGHGVNPGGVREVNNATGRISVADLIERVRAPETATGDRIMAVVEISLCDVPQCHNILLGLYEYMITPTEKRTLAGGLLIAGDLTTALASVEASALSNEAKAELTKLLASVHNFGINPPADRRVDQ